MSYLSWNCRGLGNSRIVQGLLDLKKSISHNCVFLSETRLSVQDIETIKLKLGYKNCFAVGVDDRSGGLALSWIEELDLTIKSFSKFHNDSNIQQSRNGRSGELRVFMAVLKFTIARRHGFSYVG
ncbi:hypothetical protein CFOL_v3_28814 [Cephalotus follicularis]|uniref:Exo_endo_phos domain-containing protein n=1 Tax=Cephalotus follicularis TaxID=3775 RepID=A0A1Q3CYR1_CEPFO|nr:hypothetical protein CFOL_v3_28814 [Cephalotus follicularis]